MNENELTNFLRTCTTPFHFLSYTKQLLTKIGFKELPEKEEWPELPTKGFVIRQTGAIIAYKYDSLESLFITTTKYQPSMVYLSKDNYDRNMTSCNSRDITMYQRPLKCSGYVTIRKDKIADTILFDSGDDAVSFFPIPPTSKSESLSCDFHLYRSETDDDYSVIIKYISKKLSIKENDILDFHLNFTNHQGPSTFTDGVVASQNLNFLAPAFSSLQAFLCAEPKKQMNVFCAFYDKDNLIPNRSPSIYGNFLNSFVEKVFCLDFNKKYLEKSSCICIESFELDPHKSPNNMGDKIFLLYNELNKGSKEDLNTDKKSSFNGSIDLNAFPKQKVDYRLNDSVIEENESIPSICLGFPILSLNSIREYCKMTSISQLFDVLKAYYS